jgi:SPP1 gp7 family putative phage head morphogenesis protein
MSDALTTIGFGETPFVDAIKALLAMDPMSHEAWTLLNQLAQRKAFTFADAYSDSVAEAGRKVIEQVLRGDVSVDEFREKFNEALDAFGISETPFQARTILETTLARNYADGKEREYANPEFAARNPYAAHVTAHDNRVRPNHFALDVRRIKTVFRLDDPGWQVWRCPLGFRCRCTKIAYGEEEVQANGWKVGELSDWIGSTQTVTIPGGKTQTVAVLPDAGFELMAKNPPLSPPRRGMHISTARMLAMAAAVTFILAMPSVTLAGAWDPLRHPRDEHGRFISAAIGEVYEGATADRQSRDRVRWDVTAEQAARIRQETGLDVAGYKHQIESDAVRHILREHPDMTKEDFSLIPEIVSAPDRITRTATKQGLDAITYEKNIGGVLRYVEEVRTGREELALKTFYWK